MTMDWGYWHSVSMGDFFKGGNVATCRIDFQITGNRPLTGRYISQAGCPLSLLGLTKRHEGGILKGD